MTTRSTLRLANPANLPGDVRLDDGSTRRDAVADTPERHDGASQAQLVDRPTTSLRPHPVYQELCGPLAATRGRRVSQQAGPIREPLVITTDGTILDGHARWQVAIERAQPDVPCLELDVTEDEALQVVIERHRAHEGLNDYGRIVLALSYHSGTGAADNGAGSATNMEAVRILKALAIRPKRTIRLVLWGGEEQGFRGSLGYIEKYVGDVLTGEDKGELSLISIYFNHDNNGHRIRGIFTQGNESIRPIFERYFEPFHTVGAETVSIEFGCCTDNVGFDALNIPAYSWIQDPEQYFTTQIHTNMDVVDYVSEDTLKHNAAIIAAFVYQSAMRDEMMPRRKP